MHIVINRSGECRKAQATNDARLYACSQTNQAAGNAACIGAVTPIGDATLLLNRNANIRVNNRHAVAAATTSLTLSMVHSTTEKTAPINAKFLAYECVVARISRNTSRAVCFFSLANGSAIFGFTEALNRPKAAPSPYPDKDKPMQMSENHDT